MFYCNLGFFEKCLENIFLTLSLILEKFQIHTNEANAKIKVEKKLVEEPIHINNFINVIINFFQVIFYN